MDARTSLKRREERSLLSAAAAAHPSFQSAHNPQLLLPWGLDSRFDLHIFVDMYLLCIGRHLHIVWMPILQVDTYKEWRELQVRMAMT